MANSYILKKGVSSVTDLKDGLAALGAAVGNIYYVVQTTNTYAYAYAMANLARYYSDGSFSVHTSITSAVAKCLDYRNDYVLVFPDDTDYDEGATLTLSAACMHLICPAGLGATYGCVRAATIDPNAAAVGLTITGRGVEVAGFWIRGYTEQGCITSSGVGVNIHHNDCAVTCTTSAAYGITVSSTGLGTHIHHNFIFSNAGAGTWTHGISVSPSATRTHVDNNIIDVSNASTCTCGIDFTTLGSVMGAAMMSCHDNYLHEQPAITGTSASTLTAGIRVGDGGWATGNRIALATEANATIGGTSDQSWVANYEATSGGTISQ